MPGSCSSSRARRCSTSASPRHRARARYVRDGDRSARRGRSHQMVGHERTGGRYQFRTRSCTVVYQNLLLSTGPSHERVGRALNAAGPAGRLANLEALGHHWSRGSDKPRTPRCLLAAGDWARAVYANDVRSPPRARAPHPRQCRACDAEVRVVRGARRSPGVHRPAARGPRALRRRAGGDRGGRRSGGRRPPAPEDRRTLLGSGRPRARRRLFRVGPRAARRRRRPGRARAPLSGDGSPRVSGRRQCRRHRMGRAGPRGSGARGRRRHRARPRARGRRHARAGLQHARRRARANGPTGRGGGPDRAQRRAGRGARSAAGGLSRIHEPRRPLQHAATRA